MQKADSINTDKAEIKTEIKDAPKAVSDKSSSKDESKKAEEKKTEEVKKPEEEKKPEPSKELPKGTKELTKKDSDYDPDWD